MTGWTRWGIAAVAALALTPAARADDKMQKDDRANQKTEGAQTTAPQTQGDDIRASANQKDQNAKTTPPDSTGSPGSSGYSGSASTSGDTAARGSSTAGSTSSTSQQDAKQPSVHDNSDLIKKLHASNVTEIEVAKIAKKNAQRDDVKQFADRMEKDHGDLKKSLDKLASDRSLKLDEKAELKPHQAHLDEMKNMKGAEFDRHFTQMMMSDHEQALNDVKTALKRANDTGDRELARVLDTAKNTISSHRQLAMDLDRSKGQQRMGRRPGGTAGSSDMAGEHGGATENRGDRDTQQKSDASQPPGTTR
ncbi:MAG: DUF4142 domain-containing protein, partial [Anaeromyxobacteraceae bacterium]